MNGDYAREQVRHAILRAGYSPLSFAQHIELDPGTLYDFLSGKRGGSATTRYKIEVGLLWPTGAIDKLFDGATFDEAVWEPTVERGLEGDEPVGPSGDAPGFVAGGDRVDRRTLSEFSLAELADEIRRRADAGP